MATVDDTGNRAALTFDFMKAVADARRDFPEETKNVTFVDLDAPNAAVQIEAWKQSLTPTERMGLQLRGDFETMDPDSNGFALRIGGTQKKILGMHSKFCKDIHILDSAPDKQAEFIFNHELGHLVVRGADFVEAYAESAADAFAVGRGLQNGSLTKDDVGAIISDRVRQYVLFADVLHLSVAAIDRVRLAADDQGFEALSPRAMASLAASHADAGALGPAACDKFDQAVGPADGMDPVAATKLMLRALSRVMLENDPGSAPFNVAARILEPYYQKGFIDKMDGRDAGWDKVRSVLSQRIAKNSLTPS